MIEMAYENIRNYKKKLDSFSVIKKFDDLYFVLNPDTNLVKIGRSCDIDTRIKQLECECGVELTLVDYWKGLGYKEDEVHKHLNKYRIKGEWFEHNVFLLEYIKNISL